MIILIDTSTSTCNIYILDGDVKYVDIWEADRNLANGLLKRLNNFLDINSIDWSNIKGIGVFEGPGSFTGIRIGLTVMNTIADAQNIPIVGARGENWQNDIIEKLNSNINDKIVLPFYGKDANITTQRK